MLPPTLLQVKSTADFSLSKAPSTNPDFRFNAIDIVQLATLSRLVERLRFTVGPQILDDTVTLDNLREAFRAHLEIVNRRKTTEAARRKSQSWSLDERSRSALLGEDGDAAKTGTGPGPSPPSAAVEDFGDDSIVEFQPNRSPGGKPLQNPDHSPQQSPLPEAAVEAPSAGGSNPLHVPPDDDDDDDPLVLAHAVGHSPMENEVVAETLAKIGTVWERIEANHSEILMVTYGFLFDFEFPLFPETTEAQRRLLRDMCQQEVISRGDVAAALDCEIGDQEVEFFFVSGTDLIPAEVFKDLVASLDQHPTTLSFPLSFAKTMAMAGKRMMPFWFHVVIFALIVVVSQSIAIREHHVLNRNLHHWVNNDWQTGCIHGGPMSDFGCEFLGKTFFKIGRPEQDALRYMRTEFVLKLWRQDGPDFAPARVPLGGVFPVGTANMRLVKGMQGLVSPEWQECQRSNLTEVVSHFEVPAYYPCSNEWSIDIPFNATQSEALAMVSNVSLPPMTSDFYAVIILFNGYQPSTGLFAHTQVILSFPAGGGVLPRLFVHPIDLENGRRLLPIFAIALVAFLVQVCSAVGYGISGVPVIDLPLFFDVLNFSLIAASFALLSTIPRSVKSEIDQVTYMPKDFDLAAQRFNTGMSLFAFYVLFTIGSLVRYTKDIRGLQLMFDILGRASLEILGLILMFFGWSFGFICVAILMFGSTVPDFSSIGPAAQSLLMYFFYRHNFGEIVENHPVVGPAFFFAYQLFVVYFALNLLIAIMTAPLQQIKKSSDLTETALSAFHAGLADLPVTQRVWQQISAYVLWPAVNLLFDASSPYTQAHWLRMHGVLESFYGKIESVKLDDAIDNALRICAITEYLKKLDDEKLREEDDLARAQGQLTDFDADEHELRRRTSSAILFGTVGDSPQRGFSKGNDDIDRDLAVFLWDSPLLRAVTNDSLITNDVALAFVLVTIASESQSSLFRDARLMKALRSFDSFNQGITKIGKLQATLASDSRARSENLHLQLYTASARQRAGSAALLRRTSSIISSSARNESDKFDPLQHSVFLKVVREEGMGEVYRDRKAVLASSTRVMNEGEGGLSISSETDEGFRRSSFAQAPEDPEEHGPSSPPADPPRTRRVTIVVDHSASDALGSVGTGSTVDKYTFDEDADERLHESFHQSYVFSQILSLKLENARRFLFYSIFSIAVACWYFAPFFTVHEPTAHLTRALNKGLRDFEQKMECYDANCRTGFTFNKTWNDLEDVDELQLWLRKALLPALFMRQQQNMTGASVNAVWFDPRITLESSVFVRQLRANALACEDGFSQRVTAWSLDVYAPFTTPLSGRNTSAMFTCTDAVPRNDEAWSRAPTRRAAPLGQRDANIFRDSCAEREPKVFLGKLGDYPCAGYEVRIDNATQLDQFIDTVWFDEQTRLVAITAVFAQTKELQVEYTMLLEIGENGGGCYSRAFSFPLESTSSLRDLSVQRVMVEVLLSLHLLTYFVLVIRYGYHRLVKGMPADQCVMYQPEVPVVVAILFIIVFAAFPVLFPTSTQENRNMLAHAIVGVIYLQYTVTTSVVFPLASLISKEVRVLIDTLERALINIIYVAPYVALFLGAFTLSGFIMFSRYAPEFSRMRWAFQYVSLIAFTDSFDIDVIQEARPYEAQAFALLFLVTILVALTNLFLAMVTSATEDAKHTAQAVALAEGINFYRGRTVRYGKLLQSYMAFNVTLSNARRSFSRWWHSRDASQSSPDYMRSSGSSSRSTTLKRSKQSPHGGFLNLQTREDDDGDASRQRLHDSHVERGPAIMTAAGRMLFPSETLLPAFGPLRINALMRHFTHEELGETAHAALTPFLIDNSYRFESTNPARAVQDQRLQAEQETLYADSRHAGLCFQFHRGIAQRRASRTERSYGRFKDLARQQYGDELEFSTQMTASHSNSLETTRSTPMNAVGQLPHGLAAPSILRNSPRPAGVKDDDTTSDGPGSPLIDRIELPLTVPTLDDLRKRGDSSSHSNSSGQPPSLPAAVQTERDDDSDGPLIPPTAREESIPMERTPSVASSTSTSSGAPNRAAQAKQEDEVQQLAAFSESAERVVVADDADGFGGEWATAQDGAKDVPSMGGSMASGLNAIMPFRPDKHIAAITGDTPSKAMEVEPATVSPHAFDIDDPNKDGAAGEWDIDVGGAASTASPEPGTSRRVSTPPQVTMPVPVEGSSNPLPAPGSEPPPPPQLDSWDDVYAYCRTNGIALPAELLGGLLGSGDPPRALLDFVAIVLRSKTTSSSEPPAVGASQPQQQSSRASKKRVTLVVPTDTNEGSSSPEGSPTRPPLRQNTGPLPRFVVEPQSPPRAHAEPPPEQAPDDGSTSRSTGGLLPSAFADHTDDLATVSPGPHHHRRRRREDRAAAARRWSVARGAFGAAAVLSHFSGKRTSTQ